MERRFTALTVSFVYDLFTSNDIPTPNKNPFQFRKKIEIEMLITDAIYGSFIRAPEVVCHWSERATLNT